MLEQGLFSLITGDAGVSALIATRLYPVQGPPDNPTYPYVTYGAVLPALSEYTIDGAESREKTIRFEPWSPDFQVNLQILTALRNVLTGYAGILADGTRVLFTARANEEAHFDAPSRAYVAFCEYEFLFVEP